MSRFERVGLVDPHGRLVAVSHVETIDKRSSAAEQLRAAANRELDVDGICWCDEQTTAKSGDNQDLLVRAVAAIQLP